MVNHSICYALRALVILGGIRPSDIQQDCSAKKRVGTRQLFTLLAETLPSLVASPRTGEIV